MLVDHVQQVQPPAVSGLIELEVERPHVVGAGGDQALGLVEPEAAALAALGRAAQAFVPPQAPGALAVDDPALPAQDGMRRLPAPAGMRSGDGLQSPTELVLLARARPAYEALGGAVLAGHHTGPALGHPEALRQSHHGPTAAIRGQKFPVMRWGR